MTERPKWDAMTAPRSVSQLGTMSGCGEAYRLEKIVRVPRRTAAWFAQGVAVHEAVDVYESAGRALSAEEIAEVFESHWETEIAAMWAKQPDSKMWMKGGTKSTENDIADRRVKGRQQTIAYVLANGPDEEWQPAEIAPGVLAVEVGFELDFDGVKVVGYIDQIRESRETGELRVVDVKTGTKMPSSPYQMGTYKIAVEQMTGVAVKKGSYWMCKDNKESKPKLLSQYTRENVGEWYKTMDAMVKNGTFLPNPGDCFTCAVLPYCKHESANPIPWPPQGQGMDFS